MFYKYIFFKLFNWAWKGENEYYPQIEAIYFLTLLIISNVYLILVLLDLLGILKYNGEYIYSPSTEILIITFVSMLLFNHFYFYWIDKWRDIIKYFRENSVKSKVRILATIYIIFSIASFLILYLFNIQ
jgi:hypothetical protein